MSCTFIYDTTRTIVANRCLRLTMIWSSQRNNIDKAFCPRNRKSYVYLEKAIITDNIQSTSNIPTCNTPEYLHFDLQDLFAVVFISLFYSGRDVCNNERTRFLKLIKPTRSCSYTSLNCLGTRDIVLYLCI